MTASHKMIKFSPNWELELWYEWDLLPPPTEDKKDRIVRRPSVREDIYKATCANRRRQAAGNNGGQDLPSRYRLYHQTPLYDLSVLERQIRRQLEPRGRQGHSRRPPRAKVSGSRLRLSKEARQRDPGRLPSPALPFPVPQAGPWDWRDPKHWVRAVAGARPQDGQAENGGAVHGRPGPNLPLHAPLPRRLRGHAGRGPAAFADWCWRRRRDWRAVVSPWERREAGGQAVRRQRRRRRHGCVRRGCGFARQVQLRFRV